MAQTRKQSLHEAIVNIIVGYSINVIANFTIFPWFGWDITLGQNIMLGIFYTAISLVRSYTLRRFYNWYHERPFKSRTVRNAPLSMRIHEFNLSVNNEKFVKGLRAMAKAASRFNDHCEAQRRYKPCPYYRYPV